MKKGLLILMLAVSVASCDSDGTKVTVKTDALNKELDTLGAKVSEKAETIGDSAKSKFRDLKESVKDGVDSLQKNIRD